MAPNWIVSDLRVADGSSLAGGADGMATRQRPMGEIGSAAVEAVGRFEALRTRRAAAERRQRRPDGRQRQESAMWSLSGTPALRRRMLTSAMCQADLCQGLERRDRPDAPPPRPPPPRTLRSAWAGSPNWCGWSASAMRDVRPGLTRAEHFDDPARTDGDDSHRPGGDPPKPVHPRAHVTADWRRHAVRDGAELRPPSTDPGGRRPCRRQAEPACFPAAAPPAAGLFRTQPGRLHLVDDGTADQQDPRVPDRQAADHDAGPGHADRAFANPVLSCSQCCHGWCCWRPA